MQNMTQLYIYMKKLMKLQINLLMNLTPKYSLLSNNWWGVSVYVCVCGVVWTLALFSS